MQFPSAPSYQPMPYQPTLQPAPLPVPARTPGSVTAASVLLYVFSGFSLIGAMIMAAGRALGSSASDIPVAGMYAGRVALFGFGGAVLLAARRCGHRALSRPQVGPDRHCGAVGRRRPGLAGQPARSAHQPGYLVAVLGGIIGTSWSRRSEQRRESFEIRTKLLNDTARVGQGMYVFLQYTRRQLIQADDASERTQALKALDEQFLAFSTEAAATQTVLGARFGVVRAVPTQPSAVYLPPFLRWHQIHDLLAIYYYNLKEFFPGIVLAETSVGHGGNHHSGLDMSPYSDKQNLDAEGLRRMRSDIRVGYDEAMIDLAHGIASWRIKVA